MPADQMFVIAILAATISTANAAAVVIIVLQQLDFVPKLAHIVASARGRR